MPGVDTLSPTENIHNMSSSGATQQQSSISRPPLRRAVYIHVSDLTSAYNIDHKKLEQELSRVNIELTGGSPSSHPSIPSASDDSITSMPQKRLQPPRGGFNLCVLVGKVNIVVDKLRVDRSRVRLAEVEVGDETGTVSLRARDEQIDELETVSDSKGAVVLRNCTLELFQGRHVRLAVTKWGKLNVFPDEVPSTPPPPSKMNRERNFSLIDLSLVASEMVENQPPEQGGYPTTSSRSQQHEASTNSRGTANRQPFSSSPQYSQQQRGRNPREQQHRRQQQQQQRPVRVDNRQMPIPFPEMPAQRMYGAMPGYGFGEYPYGAPPRANPESMQPHQQLMHLQQQQFEMHQHRQMQQMQLFHEQQQQQQQGDRRGQQQQQQPMLRQMQPGGQGGGLLGTPSFDSTPPEFPSLPGVVMQQHDTNRSSRASPRDDASSLETSSGPWSGKHHHSFEHGGGADDASITSAGRMNPQATAFAPSFGGGRPPMTLGGNQQQLLSPPPPYQGGFNPYDAHQQQQQQRVASPYGAQQQTIYTQNIVYVPVPSSSGVPPLEPRSDGHQEEQAEKGGAET